MSDLPTKTTLKFPYHAPDWPFLGNVPMLMRDSLAYLSDLLGKHGDVVRYDILRWSALMTGHPDAFN